MCVIACRDDINILQVCSYKDLFFLVRGGGDMVVFWCDLDFTYVIFVFI